MKSLEDIYCKLYSAYGPQLWWPARTPYEMMAGAILTQNTAWSNVEKALENLGEKLEPETIRDMSLKELTELIRPSGFFNQKAERLKNLTHWFQGYDFDISRAQSIDGKILRAELLKLKGVGGETADSILTYALNKPFFVVDAYTRRIFQRLGYLLPKDYEGVRCFIEEKIPKDLQMYNEYHALIVRHAKMYCKKKPLCDTCVLRQFCKKKV